jgi:hypothetical protein
MMSKLKNVSLLERSKRIKKLFQICGHFIWKDNIFAVDNVSASISKWAFLSKLFVILHPRKQKTTTLKKKTH